MKRIKSISQFIIESTSAGSRPLMDQPHLKKSVIYDPRLNYVPQTLIKDLNHILVAAVSAKTAVLDIIKGYTGKADIKSIETLNNSQFRSLIEALNEYFDQEDTKNTEVQLPDGRIHKGIYLDKDTKEKGDLYLDPLEKNYVFINSEGSERILTSLESLSQIKTF